MERMDNEPRIVIAPDLNVWPHELETARALAKAGMRVEFLRRSEEQRVTSADIIIDGIAWEMKAPTGDKAAVIQRNLHRALHQSPNVVFDSFRMKKLPDKVIERELRKHAQIMKSMKRLMFVNRKREVIDIK